MFKYFKYFHHAIVMMCITDFLCQLFVLIISRKSWHKKSVMKQHINHLSHLKTEFIQQLGTKNARTFEGLLQNLIALSKNTIIRMKYRLTATINRRTHQ